MRQRVEPETIVYVSFLALLAVALTGLPAVRYAVYVMPLLALIVWLAAKPFTLNLSRDVLAFFLLATLSLPSMFPWDFNTFKKIYFVYVFASVFLLFDFANIQMDMRKLALALIVLGLFNALTRDSAVADAGFSVIQSQSRFETTFAFPLTMVALYLTLTRRYVASAIALFFAVIFLKRIAIFAFVAALLIWFLPKRVRRLLLSPVSLSLLAGVVVILSISFANGVFDSWIFENLAIAPNDLSKGRQVLWSSALSASDFSLSNYLFFGGGIGSVVTNLQSELDVDRVLLHNDLLTLLLETGAIPYFLFIYLLVSVKEEMGRLFAMFMLILFSTDNVMIYQHVMFVYFFIQARIRRDQLVMSRRDLAVRQERLLSAGVTD
ncbi:MAG: hypothetical protein AAF671_03420 [Pseudomonadota bacterium]